MTTIECHGFFASRPDGGRSALPDDIEVRTVYGLDPTSALATAAVALSGMFDDCRLASDLDEAAGHFRSLLAGGIIAPEEWAREAERVICEILYWGNRQPAEVAALN